MISVLIPWRSVEPARVQAWNFLRPQWEQLDVQLCVADDGLTGPFAPALALNRARGQASGDVLLMYGADQFPPTRLDWVVDKLSRHPWTAMFATTRVFSRRASASIIGGADPAQCFAQSMVISMCTGILAMRADVFDDIGGYDERFLGWGAEDTAFRLTLRTLYPDGNDAGEGELWSLWHPDAPRAGLTARNSALCSEYEQAAAEGRLREYLKGRY